MCKRVGMPFASNVCFPIIAMSTKHTKSSTGTRKRLRGGVTSSQYTLEDDDNPSGSGADADHVRTWGIHTSSNGRFGGRRNNTKVTEMREISPEQTGFDFTAPEPETSTGDVVVEIPNILRSKNRKRKQRNDSVSPSASVLD